MANIFVRASTRAKAYTRNSIKIAGTTKVVKGGKKSVRSTDLKIYMANKASTRAAKIRETRMKALRKQY